MVRVKVPQKQEAESEERVREITREEEENMRSVVLLAYACQSSSMQKKVALSTGEDPEGVM